MFIKNLQRFTHEHKRGLYTLMLAASFDSMFAVEKFLIHFNVVLKPLTYGIIYSVLAVTTLVLALWDYFYDVKDDCECKDHPTPL